MNKFEQFKKDWPHTWWSIKAAIIGIALTVLLLVVMEIIK